MFAGLALLALSLRAAPGPAAAFARATAWAAVAGAVGMRWLPVVLDRYTAMGAVPAAAALAALALAQALAWGAGAALAHALRRWMAMPFELAFAAAVFAATSAPAVFAWSPAGLLAARPQLVQSAAIVGERGASALVALVAALAAAALTARPRARAVAPALAALALVAGADRWGAARMDAVERQAQPALRVALVDQGAPARGAPEGAVIGRLRALSARADAEGAQLVVWPEDAYPVPLPHGIRAIEGGSASPLSPGARAPRLLGAKTYDAAGRAYNSATVVLPGGRVEPPTDKRHLLPVGETMPFGLHRLLPATGDLRRGTVRALVVPAAAGPVRVGVLNCYEDLSGGAGRSVWAAARPQLLVNVTNDAWFAGTSAPALHARLAAMRAIELRTDLVRAVNDGGGEWVDAAGRVRRLALGGAGVRIATPALRAAAAPATPYARLGDWPLAAALALLALGFRIRAGCSRACASAPARAWSAASRAR